MHAGAAGAACCEKLHHFVSLRFVERVEMGGGARLAGGRGGGGDAARVGGVSFPPLPRCSAVRWYVPLEPRAAVKTGY